MIRVLIERRLGEHTEEQLQHAMRELRRTAIHRPGYMSGETLRDTEDPNHYVVISTWRSEAEWRAWAESEMRQSLERELRLLLDEPEKVTVLEPV